MREPCKLKEAILHMKEHAYKRYFYLVESFKFRCYNSLDNSGLALWKSVIKMGWILIENSKIEKLDKDIRKNVVDYYLAMCYSLI